MIVVLVAVGYSFLCICLPGTCLFTLASHLVGYVHGLLSLLAEVINMQSMFSPILFTLPYSTCFLLSFLKMGFFQEIKSFKASIV